MLGRVTEAEETTEEGTAVATAAEKMEAEKAVVGVGV